MIGRLLATRIMLLSQTARVRRASPRGAGRHVPRGSRAAPGSVQRGRARDARLRIA